MSHLNRSIFSNKSSVPTCMINKIVFKYILIVYNYVYTDQSIVQGSGQYPRFQDVNHMDYLHASCILLKHNVY